MITMEFAEISIKSLAALMKDATIGSEQYDTDSLYLSDGLHYPIWLYLDTRRKQIVFHSYYNFKEYAATDRIPELINELNGDYLMVQFSARSVGDVMRLEGSYVMFSGFGIVVPQLVHATRCFAEIFHGGFTCHDSYGLFFD